MRGVAVTIAHIAAVTLLVNAGAYDKPLSNAAPVCLSLPTFAPPEDMDAELQQMLMQEPAPVRASPVVDQPFREWALTVAGMQRLETSTLRSRPKPLFPVPNPESDDDSDLCRLHLVLGVEALGFQWAKLPPRARRHDLTFRPHNPESVRVWCSGQRGSLPSHAYLLALWRGACGKLPGDVQEVHHGEDLDYYNRLMSDPANIQPPEPRSSDLVPDDGDENIEQVHNVDPDEVDVADARLLEEMLEEPLAGHGDGDEEPPEAEAEEQLEVIEEEAEQQRPRPELEAEQQRALSEPEHEVLVPSSPVNQALSDAERADVHPQPLPREPVCWKFLLGCVGVWIHQTYSYI